MEKRPNVVIFGVAGTGKSSIVNLITGQNDAHVSDRAIGCTFGYKKYETPKYNLFDTVGLSEGSKGTVSSATAAKELYELLNSLHDGVSLLVFVIKKERITKIIEKNYKLFVNILCMKKVPVLLVVTHCEMEKEPGTWWTENKCYYDDYGMVVKDAVCGSAMNPESAPVLMQPTIKALNESMASKLNEKIDEDMLAESWIADGGTDGWLRTIVSSLLKIFGWDMSSQIEKSRAMFLSAIQRPSYDEGSPNSDGRSSQSESPKLQQG